MASESAEVRQLKGEALKRLLVDLKEQGRKDVTEKALAKLLGKGSRSSVANWKAGIYWPTRVEERELERFLGLAPGFFNRVAAGMAYEKALLAPPAAAPLVSAPPVSAPPLYAQSVEVVTGSGDLAVVEPGCKKYMVVLTMQPPDVVQAAKFSALLDYLQGCLCSASDVAAMMGIPESLILGWRDGIIPLPAMARLAFAYKWNVREEYWIAPIGIPIAEFTERRREKGPPSRGSVRSPQEQVDALIRDAERARKLFVDLEQAARALAQSFDAGPRESGNEE